MNGPQHMDNASIADSLAEKKYKYSLGTIVVTLALLWHL